MIPESVSKDSLALEEYEDEGDVVSRSVLEVLSCVHTERQQR